MVIWKPHININLWHLEVKLRKWLLRTLRTIWYSEHDLAYAFSNLSLVCVQNMNLNMTYFEFNLQNKHVH